MNIWLYFGLGALFVCLAVLLIAKRKKLRQAIHRWTAPNPLKHDIEEVRHPWTIAGEEAIRKKIREKFKGEKTDIVYFEITVRAPQIMARATDMSPQERANAPEGHDKYYRMVEIKATLENGKALEARARVTWIHGQPWKLDWVEVNDTSKGASQAITAQVIPHPKNPRRNTKLRQIKSARSDDSDGSNKPPDPTWS